MQMMCILVAPGEEGMDNTVRPRSDALVVVGVPITSYSRLDGHDAA